MESKEITAVFIGNRDCYFIKEEDIEQAILLAIYSGIKVFLNGGQGYFDITCAKVLKRLKKKYPYIKSCLVIPYHDFNIPEGIFYGSKEKAIKYGAIGAGISVVLGFFSGDLAQLMYSSLLGDDPSLFMGALTRGAGWAIMGLGIGLAIGLIRFEKKRILFCSIGGLAGAFLVGFLFNVMWHVRQAEYDRTSEHNSWHTGTVIYTYGLAV